MAQNHNHPDNSAYHGPDSRLNGEGTAQSRIVWPDLLRIVAILGVIVIHAVFLGMTTFPKKSSEYFTCHLFIVLVQYSVPLFAMISGMFLLNPEKDYSIKKIYSSNIFRLVIPLTVWSIFYALTYIFVDSHCIHKFTGADVFFLIWNGKYHMWFIYMLIGLYMITPFLRLLVQQKKIMEYFLLLVFIFVFLRDAICSFPGTNFFQSMFNRFDVHIVLGFSGYFVLGYYLSSTKLSPVIRKFLYFAGAAASLNLLFGNYLLNHYFNINLTYCIEVLGAYITSNILFMSVAVFVFFQYNFSEFRFSQRTANLIFLTGKLTFGIFWIHIFIMEHLEVIGLGRYFAHPAISVPVIVTVTFVLSFCASFILSKIPYIGKYIV